MVGRLEHLCKAWTTQEVQDRTKVGRSKRTWEVAAENSLHTYRVDDNPIYSDAVAEMKRSMRRINATAERRDSFNGNEENQEKERDDIEQQMRVRQRRQTVDAATPSRSKTTMKKISKIMDEEKVDEIREQKEIERRKSQAHSNLEHRLEKRRSEHREGEMI